ncbi:hypothetical protein L6260_00905 [Candidatus Parcubacteria bacterium]|nr:hypothetical protein [Patescibacteria group bacterium]MCG2687347.1 hypothetical protein [Candidatus Parcubacteria bacterium]
MANIRYTLLGMTSLIIAWANILSIQNPTLGAICALGYLLSLAHLFGTRFMLTGTKLQKLLIGLLASIAIMMLGGSAIYYLGSVTQLNLSILLTAILCIASICARKTTCDSDKENARSILGLSVIFALAMITWWLQISQIDIIQSVRSIWLVVDPRLLLLIATVILMTVLMVARGASKLTVTMLSILLASVLSMAYIVYILGYGFDPFIHRATVEHIAQFGTITPKPLYYIGQYSLELIGILIFSLPIKILDGLLVPLLAGILIPQSAYFSVKSLGQNWRMMLIALFLLPLGAFISTTPQALAYILTTCLVLLSLPILLKKITAKTYLAFLFILTLAILITHPLAGIPSAIFFLFVFINRLNISFKIQTTLSLITTTLGALVLPVIFIVQSAKSNLAIDFSVTNLSWDQLNLTGFFSNHFNSWLDGFYLVIDNHLWIVLILALAGIYFAKKEKLPSGIYAFIYASIASFLSYLILTLTLQFEFLIEYERSNYSDRLLTLTIIFLIPFVGITLSSIWVRIEKKSISLKLAFVLIITLIGTAMIYGAYPRHDNYARSAGFNVSQADVDCVYAIDKYAQGKDYIVLANQAVSSSAIEAFGFSHYYNNDIFYYPIPTGGELYNYYLKMTDNEPSSQTMHEAMDFTGAEIGFLVVNDYWWDSQRIIEHAKNQADDWFALGDGEVTIFIFER